MTGESGHGARLKKVGTVDERAGQTSRGLHHRQRKIEFRGLADWGQRDNFQRRQGKLAGRVLMVQLKHDLKEGIGDWDRARAGALRRVFRRVSLGEHRHRGRFLGPALRHPETWPVPSLASG